MIKKGDFVEIDYEGRIAETGDVFDTTSEKVAKEAGLHNPGVIYGPVVVCIGEQHVLKGIDKQLEGKEVGDFTFKVSPEDGFGKKDAKLFQLIPTARFRKEKIDPVPGLQINMDGVVGMVRTVTGGRTLIDFNHPLSGKDLEYSVSVKRIVTDDQEKVDAVAKISGLKCEVAFTDGTASLTTKKELPKQGKDALAEEIKKLVRAVKTVDFRVEKNEEVKPAPKPAKKAPAPKKETKKAEP